MKYCKVVTIDYASYLIYNFDMKIRLFLNKLAYLLKQNRNEILSLISISVILICFFIFAVIPYGGTLGIGGANSSIKILDQIKYALFIVPFVLLYIILIQRIIKNIKFLRVLIYPLIILLIFFCLFMCASIWGYVYIMLFFFASYYILPVIFLITEVYAIIQDIKTVKNTTVPDDYSIYQNISSTVSIWKSRVSKVFGFFKSICQRIWNYFTEDIKK